MAGYGTETDTVYEADTVRRQVRYGSGHGSVADTVRRRLRYGGVYSTEAEDTVRWRIRYGYSTEADLNFL